MPSSLDRYDDPEVVEFIDAADRHCSFPANFGEVVSVLHGLGYSLPSPVMNETDRFEAALEKWQKENHRPFMPRWSAVLEVARAIGYRKGGYLHPGAVGAPPRRRSPEPSWSRFFSGRASRGKTGERIPPRSPDAASPLTIARSPSRKTASRCLQEVLDSGFDTSLMPSRNTTHESEQLTLDSTARTEADDLAPSKDALARMLLEQHLQGLTSPSWRVRKKAARGLGELGEKAREAAPLLEAAVRDPNIGVREVALWALGKVRG